MNLRPQLSGEVVCQEAAVGRREVHAGDLVVFQVDPLEDRLVELLAQHGRGGEVLGLGVAEEAESAFEALVEGVTFEAAGSHDRLGSGYLAGDAGLLGLEQVKRDGTGIVSFEQLLPLGLQAGEGGLGAIDLALPSGGHRRDVFGGERADRGDVVLVEPDGLPVALDLAFDDVDHDGLEGAVILPLGAAEAVEVLVLGAPAVADVLEPELLTALAAAESALEVVDGSLLGVSPFG